MYRAAHSQVTCTKMVGLFRLSIILDKMQKCVYTSPKEKDVADSSSESYSNQQAFAKYQAYYHLLGKELEKTQRQSKLLRSPMKRTNSQN